MRLDRTGSSAHGSEVRTQEGVEVQKGLRVEHAQRGSGTVLRVLAADAVVVRWDRELREPARTTFVDPLALTALAEPPLAA
jgi:hypothetical protein